MSKTLKNILFKAVLGIITLHIFITHPHSDELSEKAHFELHQKSNSIIGFLRVAFHEDDKNLDNLIFTPYKRVIQIISKHSSPKVFILGNTTSIAGKIESKNRVIWDTHNLEDLLFVKLNRLRGPPFLS